MTDPQPVVVITLKEIWEAVTRLTGRVDVLITQQDTLSRDQQDHERQSKAGHDDHETRIRSLERRQWPLPTVAILLSLGGLALVIIEKL